MGTITHLRLIFVHLECARSDQVYHSCEEVSHLKRLDMFIAKTTTFFSAHNRIPRSKIVMSSKTEIPLRSDPEWLDSNDDQESVPLYARDDEGFFLLHRLHCLYRTAK